MRPLLFLTLFLTFSAFAQKRVVVIGLDGLSPDGIRNASMGQQAGPQGNGAQAPAGNGFLAGAQVPAGTSGGAFGAAQGS